MKIDRTTRRHDPGIRGQGEDSSPPSPPTRPGIDGIIATGYNPTVAAAAVLTEWHKDPAHKRIRFIGLDTAPSVLKAIKDGSIDATIAQNPFAHGYVATTALKLMLDGYRPVKKYQFIGTGVVVVTRKNVGTYEKQLGAMTRKLVNELKTGKKYLTPPGKNRHE